MSHSSLIEAIKASDLDTVRRCLKGGVDPNACTRLGLSSLHVAAVSGEVESVESLVQFGGDINKMTGWGSSVLHLAAHRGSITIVRALLRCGAHINRTDDNNDTPLHLACVEGHLDVVEALCRAGADKTIKNNAGKSAVEESKESEEAEELINLLNSTNQDEKVPPLIQLASARPLLNQTEFIPDFDVPTNESYSSIINEFSLPGAIPFKENNTKPDLIQNYTGTKSINSAQRFSFLDSKQVSHPTESQNSISSRIVLDSSISHSLDLSQPSCSLSQMLNFQNMPPGGIDSIDSSVYRETYQLFQQINPGGNSGTFGNNSTFGNSIFSDIDCSPQFSGTIASYEDPLGFSHSAATTAASASGIAHDTPTGPPGPSSSQVEKLVECLAPVIQQSEEDAQVKTILNIAESIPCPWPVEGSIVTSGEWAYGEDYVLISNTPLNVQSYQEREGSCSLIFKILHQQYGPLVLKMMVNLLNQTDHDSGQSGTLFLKKQFSAEHSVPISIPYHPNVVHLLHSYNGSTAPFKRYLPLLVPEGLDVDIDMASRTSFLAMREYPFSLKNFVNKFLEHKVKLCLMAKERIREELHLVLLLLLQSLFSLQHLKTSRVVHRDIKLDNFMMRHSGQVVLIDFGWAVNLLKPDGTPTLATEKNDIIAGNSVAWAPEIVAAHNSFQTPTLYSEVYGTSDLYTLGKTFVSVFEVFGFVEKNSDGGIQCPGGMSDLPTLVNCISLLHQMCRESPTERIDVSSAITFLGCQLFFPDCTSLGGVLERYVKIYLSSVPAQYPPIADIEGLGALPHLHTAVSKQFAAATPPLSVVEMCVSRAVVSEF